MEKINRKIIFLEHFSVGWYLQANQTWFRQGVRQNVAFAIYIKKVFRSKQKKNYENSNISLCKKYT